MTAAKERVSPVFDVELVTESVACALSKGWWTEQLREAVDPAQAEISDIDPNKVLETVPEKIALIHSEISEALEDYRVQKMVTVRREDGKPEGFPSELADIVIRIYDLLGALQYAPIVYKASDYPHQSRTSVPTQLAFMHLSTSNALDAWRRQSEDEIEKRHNTQVFVSELSLVVLQVLMLSDALKFDLHSEILMKQMYNRTRTRRHGGKIC